MPAEVTIEIANDEFDRFQSLSEDQKKACTIGFLAVVDRAWVKNNPGVTLRCFSQGWVAQDFLKSLGLAT
jgi:hypothetical protein